MGVKLAVEKIKLVIWDLDETLWSGIIAEGEVCLKDEFKEFIVKTTDAGIVHSICSKNEFETAKNKLNDLGLWDYFVFPSINYEPKGERIRDLIADMKLRAENVCFVDDNISNLNEALFYSKELMAVLPEELEKIVNYPFKATDVEHKRLKQYKILETKKASRDKCSSNEEFLFSCNIRVDLCDDCEKHIDRIHDLILRSNQLNYTKNRCTMEELAATIVDPTVTSGYVTVRDNFGDYGIVGFYAIKGGKALHYLFSCRTLGMLVEQYVYMKLGRPVVDVVGDVVTPLNNTMLPPWINQKQVAATTDYKKEALRGRILFKGPCDISQVFSFLKDEGDNVFTEFTYINENGLSVEGHNQTAHLATALISTEEDLRAIENDLPWIGQKAYETCLKTEKIDCLVLSMVTDASLGVYRHKKTGGYVSVYPKRHNVLEGEGYEKFCNFLASSSKFCAEEVAEKFRQAFEWVPNDDFSVTMSSLDVLYTYLEKRGINLILLLGSCRPYPGVTSFEYADREKQHRLLNEKLEEWTRNKTGVHLLPIDNHITGDKCFLDTINHFTKNVYYGVAKELMSLVGADQSLKLKGSVSKYKETLLQSLKIRIKKMLRR